MLASYADGGRLLQAGVAAATAATSASLLLGVLPQLSPPAAQAITNEQLLYLEAWRAVDRAYVDKTFNGNSWFRVHTT
jgi:carboxyl-terminal processing protease